MSILSIDQQICEFFANNAALKGWGIIILAIIALVVTIVCAGIIGFEREFHGHAAGLRTHLLVALGSALVMFLSIYGFGKAGMNTAADGTLTWQRDPARLAAQVVSGIGFLGAGTIIRTGSDIKGLTTATTIWFAMAIGLAAGSGNFILCLIATILAFATLYGMRAIEKRISKHNPVIEIKADASKSVVSGLLDIASKFGISLRDINVENVKISKKDYIIVTSRIVYAEGGLLAAFADEIKKNLEAEEVNINSRA